MVAVMFFIKTAQIVCVGEGDHFILILWGKTK